MTDIKKYIDISDLEVWTNQSDFRRDLHIYYEYMFTHDVKRTYRDNTIGKADYNRLAKIIIKNSGFKSDDGYIDSWIDFIDSSALKLKIVTYATEGSYQGFHSYTMSYPDNYIDCNEDRYNKFLELSLLEQEKTILNTLLTDFDYKNNEFFTESPLGRLSKFSSSGCATGIMPYLNFASPRKFLLNILKDCKEDTWYSTKSLIQLLKKKHSDFLIPRRLNRQYNNILKYGKYQNFKENEYGNRAISERDSSAFERVEGRWIERFLEGLPFSLGYIDTAYSKEEYNGRMPERGILKAFKVSGKLQKILNNEPVKYKLFILPNFELHLESELYPAKIVSLVKKLGKTLTMDKKVIIKLIKKDMLNFIKDNPGFDIMTFMKDEACKEVPQNVIMEIKEWIHASDSFLLYENYSIFEGDENIEGIKDFFVEKISSGLFLVKDSGSLYSFLENKELIPERIKHPSSSLRSFSGDYRTIFPKDEELKDKKETIVIMQETLITYFFPTIEILEEFQKKLIEKKCPVISNIEKLTLSFYKKQESLVKKCINELDYTFQLKNK